MLAGLFVCMNARKSGMYLIPLNQVDRKLNSCPTEWFTYCCHDFAKNYFEIWHWLSLSRHWCTLIFYFHTYSTLIAQIMTRKIRSCHNTGYYTVIALQKLMMTLCCFKFNVLSPWIQHCFLFIVLVQLKGNWLWRLSLLTVS